MLSKDLWVRMLQRGICTSETGSVFAEIHPLLVGGLAVQAYSRQGSEER
jgi:hypothetical protein